MHTKIQIPPKIAESTSVFNECEAHTCSDTSIPVLMFFAIEIVYLNSPSDRK